FGRAIVDCKTAIALRPTYYYAYNNLGAAYLGVSDYRDALTVLDRAIELKSDFFWSRVNRAKANAGIGSSVEAIRDYEYALNLDPSNEEIRQALAELKSRSSVSVPSINGPNGHVTIVPMQNDGGTYVVPVVINNTITLNFVVDSGAVDVSIPA